jgi:hypothetical protein
MIHKLNYLATRACDLLLAPLAGLPPFWGILFLSVLTSLFVLVIYRWISSPGKVRETKNQIKANILAIRLYRDFWKAIVSSFFKSLYYTGKYFVLNLAPLLAVLPLLFLLFVQMDVRYGMRPFRPGESIAVKARFAGDIAGIDAAVGASPHYRAVMNPVFVDALREVNWKLQAGTPGTASIAVTAGGVTVNKNLVIGGNLTALSNRKLAASSLEHFIYPVERLLQAPAPIRSVAIQYPARSISFLGLRTHWLVWYLLLTFAIALALKNRFGVEF